MEYTIASEANAPDIHDTAAQEASFREKSYVVLPNLFTKEQVQAMNEAIDRERAEHGFLWWFEGNPRCACNLIVSQPVFDVAYRTEPVLRLLTSLMAPDFVFEETSVQITEPSDTERATGWHRDTRHWKEHPLGLDYPQLITYLTDVDDTTHCFSISPEPGSPNNPEDWEPRGGTVHFYGQAGTAILFNSAAVHGLTTRKTTNQRRILQVYYGHPHRPSINNSSIIPPRLWRDHPDPEVRRFFGSKFSALTRVMCEGLSISVPNPKEHGSLVAQS